MRTIPAANLSNTIHFAGLVIRAQLHSFDALLKALEQPELDVFTHDENGRIVLVIEADSERTLANKMDEISQMPGVISVSLSYHEIADADSIDDLIEQTQEASEALLFSDATHTTQTTSQMAKPS